MRLQGVMFAQARKLIPSFRRTKHPEVVPTRKTRPTLESTYDASPSTSSTNSLNEQNNAARPNTHRVPLIKTVKHSFSRQMKSLSEKLIQADKERRSTINPDHAALVSRLSSAVVSGSCHLLPIGSTVNGLRCSSSDFDMVLLPAKVQEQTPFLKDFHSNSEFRQEFFFLVGALLEKALAAEGVSIVDSTILHYTTVPLLIVRLSNGLNLDIQVPTLRDSHHAIRNSHLIRCYAQCDARFPQLYLFARSLFESLGIRNSKLGMLSSYHITLLVVHFLHSQKCLTPWTVLPVLCQSSYADMVNERVHIEDVIRLLQGPPRKIDYVSKNDMSVGQLAVRFVDYYAKFHANKDSIMISTGSTGSVSSGFHRGGSSLHLFDPFSPRNVCSSRDAGIALADAMLFVRKQMFTGKMLDTFPEFPEKSEFVNQTMNAPWRQQMERMRHKYQHKTDRTANKEGDAR